MGTYLANSCLAAVVLHTSSPRRLVSTWAGWPRPGRGLSRRRAASSILTSDLAPGVLGTNWQSCQRSGIMRTGQTQEAETGESDILGRGQLQGLLE